MSLTVGSTGAAALHRRQCPQSAGPRIEAQINECLIGVTCPVAAYARLRMPCHSP